ncbi:MAG: SDR family oxidoreductase [Myxococcota bacterium]|nr:SDR family oxidoreductase [Myxococcota bacterium]
MLKGKRALVCGASAGIGRAIAIHLSQLGVEVWALARRTERLKSLHSYGIHSLVADLDDREEAERRVREQLPFHILINNTAGPKSGALLETDEDEFIRAFGRHVLMSHRLVRLALPGMIELNFGRIINIISTSVYEPIPHLGVSNTIRGAMASWAKSLSRELPPCVTINNVLPGFTDTERLQSLQQTRADTMGVDAESVREEWLKQVPLKRIAQPDEIARAVSLLLECSYVHGVSLAVDGGRLRSI